MALNATLYQPPLDWRYAWLKDWSPIILGIAQVAVAAVLAWLTYKLWVSTSKYSDQVKTQTGIMTRGIELSEKSLKREEVIRQIARLNKEMDLFIAPLNSIFSEFPSMKRYMAYPWLRKEGVPSGQGDHVDDYTLFSKKGRYGLAFEPLGEPEAILIDIMREHGHLAQPNLRRQIKEFLAFYPYGKQSNYREIYDIQLTIAAKICGLVKERYDEITDQLDKLESEIDL